MISKQKYPGDGFVLNMLSALIRYVCGYPTVPEYPLNVSHIRKPNTGI